ncbi:hypothetical protein SUGI_0330870 [Cryptomeria japonica]|uniref:RNA polymerase II transcriptional coactivator KELP isoform X2 n=1 Tax=Cryptomeria japonica TaxID=3369 RepID=UPI002408CBDB|nr:RNA polymerase II transcriptional coactivator KELP isoform X2 [Cryptomeria japonica]GLJ18582.1 hypothetical protein SUGI_0330870 [Cryptomeria japonica]
MELNTNLEIEKTVLGILENADMSDMTEYKLRRIAGEKLGQELSDTKSKKLVRSIVESFLRSKNSEEEQAAEQVTVEKEDEEVEEKEEKKASKKQQKKKQVQSEEEEEEEEEEEDERPVKKQRKEKSKESGAAQKISTDDNGDLVICKLSDRRSVTIQNFRGQKLISIREFYEKDGKLLPSSKGISLKKEQWEAFKKGVPAIEAAIEQMKDY